MLSLNSAVVTAWFSVLVPKRWQRLNGKREKRVLFEGSRTAQRGIALAVERALPASQHRTSRGLGGR